MPLAAPGPTTPALTQQAARCAPALKAAGFAARTRTACNPTCDGPRCPCARRRSQWLLHGGVRLFAGGRRRRCSGAGRNIFAAQAQRGCPAGGCVAPHERDQRNTACSSRCVHARAREAQQGQTFNLRQRGRREAHATGHPCQPLFATIVSRARMCACVGAGPTAPVARRCGARAGRQEGRDGLAQQEPAASMTGQRGA